MKIRTELLSEVTIRRFERMTPVVELDPPYQRESGVWKEGTQSALIDSIINGLDVPKLYFETANRRRIGPEGLSYQYAVIDGKQRLEAIIAFLSGDLRLGEDFRFFEDDEVQAAGMTLTDLQDRYSHLARRFLDFELPIVKVTTDSGDLIEEMFQRLNASSALNAAERRNAISGPTRDAANTLAEHELLLSCSPIRSARYKYRELGAKFLAIEHQLATRDRILDTKADTLYALFLATRSTRPDSAPDIAPDAMSEYRKLAEQTLDRMLAVFEPDDPLLASIGTVVVYYITFRDESLAGSVDREKLLQFESLRREASSMAEDAAGYGRPANVRLREYNVFVQSTNDGRALERRAQILQAYLVGYAPEDPLAGLDDIADGEIPEEYDADD